MLKVKKLSRKDLNEYIKDLRDNGIPFELQYNNSSMTLIEDDLFEFYASEALDDDEDLDLRYTGFIAHVKNHIVSKINSGELKPGKFHERSVQYFDVGIKKNTTIRDCYEIDIDSAYWETAYKLGYITRKIYRYGKTLPKKVRLMALGVLSKKTTVFKFDGKKMFKTGVIHDKKTAYFWNKICGHVSSCMTTISSNIPDSDYLFYWVDAIFVKSSSVDQVKDMIKEMGYNFKVKKVGNVSFSKGKIEAGEKSFLIPSGDKADLLKDIL